MIVYEVRDCHGDLRAYHTRRDLPDGSKTMAWRSPDGSLGLDGMATTDLPLFNADLIGGWPETEPVVLVEGEKAAAALTTVGTHAVGSVTGASATPGMEVLADLTGRLVLLWPDNDEAGRRHMLRIAAALDPLAAVGWVEWPAAPAGGRCRRPRRRGRHGR